MKKQKSTPITIVAKTDLAQHIISGILYNEFNIPMKGISVQVYHIGLRTEVSIGKDTTDESGFYSVSYDTTIIGSQPDVLARAFNPDNTIITQSPVYYNIADNFELNFKVGNTSIKGTNEFDRIIQKIEPVVKAQNLAIEDLKEDEQIKDISYLSGQTGEAKGKINLAPAAFQVGKEVDLHPSVFYALSRTGLPASKNELLRKTTGSVKRALKTAVDKNIFSGISEKDLNTVVEKLNTAATQTVLTGTDKENKNFQKIISAVLPAAELQQTFVSTWFNNEETPAQFWDKLATKTGFTDGKNIAAVKKMLDLHHFTAYQPAFTAALVKDQENLTTKELRGFGVYTQADWKIQINKLVTSGELTVENFPKEIPGTTAAEKTENYATHLANTLKQRFPLDVFAQRMKQDTTDVFNQRRTDLQTFFSKNSSYELGSTNISSLLAQASFEGVQDRNNLVTELEHINRLYKLTDDYAPTATLRKNNITSASAISLRFSKGSFQQQFSGVFGSEENAGEVYRKAKSVYKKATAIAVGYKATNDIPLYAINGIPDDATREKLKVTLQEMFGDATLCPCEECSSVHSPAAYLVDVLHFLKEQSPAAFTELTRRRPDLTAIHLTCSNTNTSLPYIDLVNELLEPLVAGQPITAFQTTDAANVLAAYPQHLLAAAYTALEKSAASYQLPMTRALESSRIFLDKLGTSRQALLETFLPYNTGDIFQNTDIAKEILQLTDAEVNVLNGTTPITGKTNNTTVEGILNETGLSYLELLQVLESYFLNVLVNGVRTWKIVSTVPSEPTTCDIAKLSIPGMQAAGIINIIRFRRLQQKLGWSVADLDMALTAMNVRSFDLTKELFNTTIVIPLAQIVRLCERLILPVQKVLALQYNIDAAVYENQGAEGSQQLPALYEQLFRDKTVFSAINPNFKERPEQLTGTLTENAATILTALNITQDDLALLRSNQGSLWVNIQDSLNWSNLSLLYRRSMLPQMLDLSVSELISMIQYTGITPFGGGFGNTLRFIDCLDIIRSINMNTQNLGYLLKDAISDTAQAAPVTVIAENLERLREGLKKITAESDINDPANNDKAQALVTDQFGSMFQLSHAIAKVLLKDAIKFMGSPVKSYMELLLSAGFIDGTGPLAILVNSKAVPAAGFERLFKAYWYTEKMAGLIDQYKLSVEEILFLIQNAEPLSIKPFLPLQLTDAPGNDIPFAAFRQFHQLMQFRNSMKGKDPKWTALVKIILTNNASEKSKFIDAFSAASSIDIASLEVLLGKKAIATEKGILNLAFSVNYIGEQIMQRTLACYQLATRMGCSIKDIGTAISAISTPFLKDEVLLTAIEPLLRSKGPAESWLSVIKPISNKLRIRRRDALTAYVLADPALTAFRTTNRIADTNSLYTYLLIDVEMDACMYTSRIKQAIGSVQLFIDRCLMNLEPGATLDANFASQWNEWRKQYRVWEANRKIFLYPENWIEPELRDDKTHLFKEVESSILQNEVTKEMAEKAVRNYILKLNSIANMQVLACFSEKGPNTGGDIIHVFARTRGLPNQYYYRKKSLDAWTPWEPLELEIEGDHLLPVIWDNRLMLFWGIFTEKQESSANTGIVIKRDSDTTIPARETSMEVKLAWSVYENGSWAAKKISTESIQLPSGLMRESYGKSWPSTKSYMSHSDQNCCFSSTIVNGKLYIRALISMDNTKSNTKGAFCFNDHYQPPYVVGNTTDGDLKFFWICCPPGTLPNHMSIGEYGNDTLTVYGTGTYFNANTETAETNATLFQKTPGDFQLLPLQHEIEKNEPSIFFYENGVNNFYAYPDMDPIAQLNKNTVHPFDGSALARAKKQGGEGGDQSGDDQEDGNGGDGGEGTGGGNTGGGQQYPPNDNDDDEEPPQVVQKYRFETFYHPYMKELTRMLQKYGMDAVFKESMTNRPTKDVFTTSTYNPTTNVSMPYPTEKMDFSPSGAYTVYNWELFFHLPLLIATRLSQNQQFEEARKWFHYIFDPTKPAQVTNAGSERFWIIQPFKRMIAEGIVDIDAILNDPDNVKDLQKQLKYWEQHPFKPHAVARLRMSAYMRTTVLKYIDNLIAWGDQLFAKDTIESINEATLLYVLAANILGKRPNKIPVRSKPAAFAFNDVANKLNDFSNTNVRIQLFIAPSAVNEEAATDETITMPLFGTPQNELLLKRWDTVADRLFKIRHCMNIQGIGRELPLFEPPIDPALLVKATAMGLDLNSIMTQIDVPLPHYRFQVMLQQANAFCNDVKALGAEFLSALEKKDAERLALLRSGHEVSLLKAMRYIKALQRDETKSNLESLIRSREVIEERRLYYGSLPYRNASEKEYFDSLDDVLKFQDGQAAASVLANMFHMGPDYKVGAWSFGASFGGSFLGHAATAAGAILGHYANAKGVQGARANTIGGFDRRRDDWSFQFRSANLELKQIDKQIIAAEIRLAIAEKEMDNHDLQQENSREADDYMRSKFTNTELYDYMIGQISAVYFQSYQLAYTTAKKAEKCLQHELGTKETYIQFGSWDSLKKGLLSGEKLQYDLRKLENAYLEQNKREFEITKHISLALINPRALFSLKETGVCDINLPELLFDLDLPGQYFRRIKSVSISIPCIAGPYTSVNATLKLSKGEYRAKHDLDQGYKKQTNNETRFVTLDAMAQPAMAIATSHGQNDSGMFELNFRDERYLPFEGVGVDSTWQLELMKEKPLRQFDYDTISDVIIHLKYTAKEGTSSSGGKSFKKVVTDYVMDTFNEIMGSGIPLSVLFDTKHEFTTEWQQFVNGTDAVAKLNLPVSKSRLPFFTVDKEVKTAAIKVYFKRKDDVQANVPIVINNKAATAIWMPEIQLFEGALTDPTGAAIIIKEEATPLPITMSKDNAQNIESLYLLLEYKVS
jgi:hypothetical protein